MRKIHIESDFDFSFLPPFYSVLNGISAFLLIWSYVSIRKKNILVHERLMKLALSISVFFLLCYVVYHITTPETRYCKEGLSRIVYFIFLASHVILAALSFPFVLFTFIRGYTGQIERHKKLARWVFPVWLYVCMTGPICYLMLRPCYV